MYKNLLEVITLSILVGAAGASNVQSSGLAYSYRAWSSRQQRGMHSSKVQSAGL